MNIKKGLTIAVILLFIGVAFGQSVNANVGKELVEITTETYGFNGKKHVVQLSTEGTKEVEALFDSFRGRLNLAESKEEAEKILKELIVELDNYSLLCDLSVEQAQLLVTGRYQNPRMMKTIENLFGTTQDDNNSNFCCLVVGKTDNTLFANPRIRFIYPFVHHWTYDWQHPLQNLIFKFSNNKTIFTVLMFNVFIIILLTYWRVDFIEFYQNNLFPRRCMIYIGEDKSGGIPSSGWINTYGVNGKISWEGEFYGNLPFEYFPQSKQCPAVEGFRGFQIRINKEQDSHFYLGSSRWVKIGSNPPDL